MNAIRFAALAVLCLATQALAAGHAQHPRPVEVHPVRGPPGRQRAEVLREAGLHLCEGRLARHPSPSTRTTRVTRRRRSPAWSSPARTSSGHARIDQGGPTKGAHPAHFIFATLKITPTRRASTHYLNTAAPGTCGTKKWEARQGAGRHRHQWLLGGLLFNSCPWEQDVVKVVGDELFFGARPAEAAATRTRSTCPRSCRRR